MKHQKKLVAVLSATGLMVVAGSAVAFAAGWDNSTGEWQYLDNYGDPVVNEWKKSGDNWFYLGNDGNMERASLVEDSSGSKTKYYYVNDDGVRVSNSWVAVENTDSDLSCDYFWYYFGSDGAAYTSSGSLSASELKTINGKKYGFDSEGRMLYGWVSDEDDAGVNEDEAAWENAAYYFGDANDGALRTGWQQLSVVDDSEDEDYWFYFTGSGKKVADTSKKINDYTYLFDTDGHMLTDWATATASDATASTAEQLYLNGDGAVRRKAWIWAVPSEEYLAEDYSNDTASWWYAGGDGALYKDTISKINGKRYAFDSYGRMLTGLVSAEAGDDAAYTAVTDLDEDAYTGSEFAAAELGDSIYLFGDSSDGSMKYGYQTVEFADDSYQLYFNTSSGAAGTGYISKIKKFTANGLVLKADTDESNYAAVLADYDEGGGSYELQSSRVYYGASIAEDKSMVLINSAGTVMKSKTNVKDSNDMYYCTDAYGRVTYVGSEKYSAS